jgi:hypothetical protein
MNRKKIYVAGKYSADNVLQVLENIRIGMRVATRLLIDGFSPFCPWLDHHFVFMLHGDEKLEVKDFYEYSLSWLEVSDAVLVLPGFESSKGTAKEIERAKELFIPVFYDEKELKEWSINPINIKEY